MSNLNLPSAGNPEHSIATVAQEIKKLANCNFTNQDTRSFYKAVSAEEFFQNQAVIDGYLYFQNGQKTMDRHRERFEGATMFISHGDKFAWEGAFEARDVAPMIVFANGNRMDPKAQAPTPVIMGFHVHNVKKNFFSDEGMGSCVIHGDGFPIYKGWEQKNYEVIVTLGFASFSKNENGSTSWNVFPRKFQADIQAWNAEVKDDEKIVMAL